MLRKYYMNLHIYSTNIQNYVRECQSTFLRLQLQFIFFFHIRQLLPILVEVRFDIYLFLLSAMLDVLAIVLFLLFPKLKLSFKFLMLVFLLIFVHLLYVFAGFLRIKILHLLVISVFDFLSLLMIDWHFLKFHHIFSSIFISINHFHLNFF